MYNFVKYAHKKAFAVRWEENIRSCFKIGAAHPIDLKCMCRQGPASLLSASTDIDAPNSMDYAFMKKARGTQNLKAHFQDLAMKRVPSKQILQMQNHKLERQVCTYVVGRKSGGICVEIANAMLSVPTSAIYAGGAITL